MTNRHHPRVVRASLVEEKTGSHATAHVAQALEGLIFPVNKQTLMDYMRQQDIAHKQEVLKMLNKLTEKPYESPMQVMAEIPE